MWLFSSASLLRMSFVRLKIFDSVWVLFILIGFYLLMYYRDYNALFFSLEPPLFYIFGISFFRYKYVMNYYPTRCRKFYRLLFNHMMCCVLFPLRPKQILIEVLHYYITAEDLLWWMWENIEVHYYITAENCKDIQKFSKSCIIHIRPKISYSP